MQEEDEEERELQAALFGTRAPSTTKRARQHDAHEGLADEELFVLDEGSEEEEEKEKREEEEAWADSDDEEVQVDLQRNAKLRRLRKYEEEQVISGREYQERLKEQHEKTVQGSMDWLREDTGGDKREMDEDEAFLKQLSMPTAGGRKNRMAGAEPRFKRMVDANHIERSQSVIQTLEFHWSNQDLLMCAGLDKRLRLFKVNANLSWNRNEPHQKVQSIFFQDLPITSAKFYDQGKAIISGKKSYYYIYDIESGHLKKISQVFGQNRKEEASSFHQIETSKDHHEMVAIGLKNGNIALVEADRGRELSLFKLPGSNSISNIRFVGDYGLMSTSSEDQIYYWDIRKPRKCVWARQDPGLVNITTFDVHRGINAYALGTDSGIVNLYSLDDGTSTGIIKNLTTPITACKYNTDGRLLGMASKMKPDAMRIYDMAAGSVIKTFPAFGKKIGHISKIAFNDDNYMACGNDQGKVLLYQIDA